MRPRVDTEENGCLWLVVFYCNVELVVERLKNSGLETGANIILIRHIKETRMDTAIIWSLTLQPFHSVLYKSLYPLVDMMTAHPRHGRNVGDGHPVCQQ